MRYLIKKKRKGSEETRSQKINSQLPILQKKEFSHY